MKEFEICHQTSKCWYLIFWVEVHHKKYQRFKPSLASKQSQPLSFFLPDWFYHFQEVS